MDTTLAVLLLLRGMAASVGQLLVGTTLAVRLRLRGVPLGTVVVTARPVSALAPPTRGLPILRWQQGLGRLGLCRPRYCPWPLAVTASGSTSCSSCHSWWGDIDTSAAQFLQFVWHVLWRTLSKGTVCTPFMSRSTAEVAL